MNEVFVNSRNAFLPAYDWGGALVWKYQDWTLRGCEQIDFWSVVATRTSGP